jgi:hypothetical protein
MKHPLHFKSSWPSAISNFNLWHHMCTEPMLPMSHRHLQEPFHCQTQQHWSKLSTLTLDLPSQPSCHTLNLLWASRINPQLLAYAQLFGSFDYNAMQLALHRIQVLLHEKPSIRGSWAPHGEDGWYFGPAMQHYYCYTIHVNQMNSECIGDTVAFFPEHITDKIHKALRTYVQCLSFC